MMESPDRMHVIHQALAPAFDYPVVFTRDLFHPDSPLFVDTLDRRREHRRHRALCFVDSGVAAKHPDLVARIARYALAHDDRLELPLPPRVVPGGEQIKNEYRLTMEIVDTILECGLCRHSCVVAVGGGAVLDAVGFAAAIVHRGLRLVRVPTTVLAQNDGGVGVKNGMNLHGGKNTVGTFAPPFAVLNDFDFLRTLSNRDWRAGIAEAFKVAMIQDDAFFAFLCDHAGRLAARDQGLMERLIVRCAELHLAHIRDGGDPFETGAGRPLDFGHWSAHKLESMSAYRIRHGEAVAVGIALDSYYAWRQGWLTQNEFDAVIQGLGDSGLPLWFDELGRRLGDGTYAVLAGLREFQEHLGGELVLAFPDHIGRRRDARDIDPAVMEDGIHLLKQLARPIRKKA